MKSPILIAALIAIGVAAFTPLASHAQPHISVVINTAPPAPVYEVIPAPRRGYVWAPGFWEWRKHRHHWVPGHYVTARPGYVYAPPSWHHRGDRWVMEPSRWNRGPAHHYGPPPGHYRDHGDRHHGKHDKHDRHHGRDRDRDGIRDRHDRDRDGDGVRNRHDRRPDNPYRY
jgi:hypothetical protein